MGGIAAWIMNNLSHAIRRFNRFELKYLITLQQAEQFKSGLRAYLVPDEHGNNNGRYTVSSLYYDSPGFRCYWEKLDGLRVRRKLRIRRYETGGVLAEEAPVFLEIKQRVDRVTQKRRVILPYGEALRLCNDRQIPEYAPEDKATLCLSLNSRSLSNAISYSLLRAEYKRVISLPRPQ